MTIHMHRYARMVGMSPRELELFAELWPMLHGKEKGSEDSETIADTAIISQKEADAYENQDEVCTQI